MAELTIPTNNAENSNVQNVNGTALQARETTREPERYVTPAVDIYETENGLAVVADLPGLHADGLTVSVEKDVLTIRGVPAAANGLQYVYREFEPVGYFRQFELGRRINQGAINAEYKHGVLRLTLPFAEEAKARQITVQVA